MWDTALTWFGIQTEASQRTAGKKRHPKWSATRKAWLKDHPTCAATGRVDNLEVHHKLPFHECPELELDPANLITLCEVKTFHAHLQIGHRGRWDDWNPQVELYAKICLDLLKGERSDMNDPEWFAMFTDRLAKWAGF